MTKIDDAVEAVFASGVLPSCERNGDTAVIWGDAAYDEDRINIRELVTAVLSQHVKSDAAKDAEIASLRLKNKMTAMDDAAVVKAMADAIRKTFDRFGLSIAWELKEACALAAFAVAKAEIASLRAELDETKRTLDRVCTEYRAVTTEAEILRAELAEVKESKQGHAARADARKVSNENLRAELVQCHAVLKDTIAADDTVRLRAELETANGRRMRLRAELENVTSILEDAQSGHIPGCGGDMEWRRSRDVAVKDARAALGVQADAENIEHLKKLATSALFHYWNCDGECGKLPNAMAQLALAVGYSCPSVDDDIRAAINAKGSQ